MISCLLQHLQNYIGGFQISDPRDFFSNMQSMRYPKSAGSLKYDFDLTLGAGFVLFWGRFVCCCVLCGGFFVSFVFGLVWFAHAHAHADLVL